MATPADVQRRMERISLRLAKDVAEAYSIRLMSDAAETYEGIGSMLVSHGWDYVPGIWFTDIHSGSLFERRIADSDYALTISNCISLSKYNDPSASMDEVPEQIADTVDEVLDVVEGVMDAMDDVYLVHLGV